MYLVGIQRHGSVRQSATVLPTVTIQPDYNNELVEDNHLVPDHQEDVKKVDFEEEERKQKVSAHARWLWAFNKILLQIHVSLHSLLLIHNRIGLAPIRFVIYHLY